MCIRDRVLTAVGADDVFNPEEEAARWMVQRLLLGDISTYFELADGFSLMEIKAPKGGCGKTVRELDLRRTFRINLVALKRYEKDDTGALVMRRFDPVPSPDEQILENDVLALAGSIVDLASFMGHFDMI